MVMDSLIYQVDEKSIPIGDVQHSIGGVTNLTAPKLDKPEYYRVGIKSTIVQELRVMI